MNQQQIDNLQLSLFAYPRAYASTLTSLAEIVRMMRHDDIVKYRTSDYRKALRAMGKGATTKNIKERLMHAFSVAVTFRGLGHGEEQAAGWTGLALCDIDHVDSPERLEQAFKALSQDPHALLIYRTISGQGLRIIYPYRRANGKPIDRSTWLPAFMTGNEHFAHLAGLDYDTACKDLTRLSGMAHDPQLHYNPSAEPFALADDLIVEVNCEHQQHGKPRKRYATGSFETEAEQAWPRVQQLLAERQLEYQPGHRHDYILHAAYLFNRFGTPLDKLLPWAETEWGDIEAKEREQAIRHCYNKAPDHHGSWKLNKRGKGRENAMITLPEIRQWLSEHVRIRFNQVTDRMHYSLSDGQWQQVDTIFINSLRGRMADDTGKRVLTSDVRSVIESDFAKQVHPVREYMAELPSWDGKDRVAELSAHVRVKAPTERHSDEEAQRELHEALHKWLVAMVATWMSDKVGNQQILTLIGPQGIYKTTFFRHLLPPPLHPYFWENAHNSFRNKDDKIALTENCLAVIEEVDAIEGRDMAELKGLVTSQYIKERRPYGEFRELKPRLASFCATGNEQKILTDKTGNRRWLCFLVTAIDDPHLWQLDYEQLYAQLLHEYREGFRYWLTSDEERRVEQMNLPFCRVSPEEELIMSRLRKPHRHETPKLMNASMIAVLLSGGVNRGISIHKIGEVMRRLDFGVRRKRNGDYYRVVEIPYEQQQNYLASEEETEDAKAEKATGITSENLGGKVGSKSTDLFSQDGISPEIGESDEEIEKSAEVKSGEENPLQPADSQDDALPF